MAKVNLSRQEYLVRLRVRALAERRKCCKMEDGNENGLA